MAVLVAQVMAEEEDVLGVVIASSGFQCGKNCAIGPNGMAVYGDGHGNYITSNGFAYKSGDSYVARDSSFITKSSGWFYGTKSAIQAGNAYLGETSTFVGTSRPVSLRKP